MAGHSVDEYLETIYFLAFPIGEYRPLARGLPHARLAGGRDARRLARVRRRDAEAARGRGAGRARRAQGGAADRLGPGPRGAGRPQAPDHRAAADRLHGLHARPRRTCTPTSSATRSPTTWSSGSPSGSATRTAAPTAGRSIPISSRRRTASSRALAELGAGHAGDDRPARRARRRAAALVLRRGPVAGHRDRGASRGAGRGPVRGAARTATSARSARRPPPASSSARPPSAGAVYAGCFAAAGARGRAAAASASALSVRSQVKSWSSRPKWPYAAVLA